MGSVVFTKRVIVGETKPTVPEWIKNNAGWWAEGAIDDDAFIQGIQFLIKEDVLQIPATTSGEGTGSNEIPSFAGVTTLNLNFSKSLINFLSLILESIRSLSFEFNL